MKWIFLPPDGIAVSIANAFHISICAFCALCAFHAFLLFPQLAGEWQQLGIIYEELE